MTKKQQQEYASLDDFKIKRDGNGDLLPNEVETDKGLMKVVPLRYGDMEKYQEEIENVKEMNTDTVAEFCRRVKKPDMSNFTAEDVKDLKPMAVQEILLAIFKASDLNVNVNVNKDNTAEVELNEDEDKDEEEKEEDIKN